MFFNHFPPSNTLNVYDEILLSFAKLIKTASFKKNPPHVTTLNIS